MREMIAAGPPAPNGPRKRIIVIGSVHSKTASLNKSAYIAAKHGLGGFTKCIAKEGAQHGISSNMICPGFVLTPLVQAQIPQQAQQLKLTEEQIVKNVMLRDTVNTEWVTVENIADTALFLAAFPNDSLTGQSIVVSNGWNMQ
jgi:3-hydroxybutyrate dehydrogenase